jgi:hypothetical protein
VGHGQLPRLVVWAVDAGLVLWLDDELEDDVATLEISSSRSVAVDFVAVDDADDPDEPVADAAAVVGLGAWAANHAPSPRNDAALTAPVMRRARRAGCGFFGSVMVRGCARGDKTI